MIPPTPSDPPAPGVHLYTHIPFCARRCSYCDFAIAVRKRIPGASFVDTVLREWQGWQNAPVWNRENVLRTLYLGGGTPSLLPTDDLARFLEGLLTLRPLAPGAEVTLEANPDDVTPAVARAWAALGVTRVSLGAQSFAADALAWMHRTHETEDIARAVDSVRDAGIGDVSLDLIFGLPDEVQRDWEADLDRALALDPDHLSIYGLTVEPRTPLARWVARGRTALPPESRYAREFLTANARLNAAGFEHYEVSNAARPGRRSRHNSAYWTRAPYVGLGPSAHSAWGRRRQWNVAPWEAYRRRLAEGHDAVDGHEDLDAAALALEDAYLGLRTVAGVPVDRVPPEHRTRWQEAGWAMASEGRLVLTAEGWLRLDALAGEVLPP